MLLKSTSPSQKDLRMSGVDVGGFGGAAEAAEPQIRIRRSRKDRPARPRARIWFWHDLFDHVNNRWGILTGNNYPWTNADRKILANLSRKYGVPVVMAMWDFYFNRPAAWFKSTGGRMYGMARDGDRLRGLPGFSERVRDFTIRLNAQHEHISAAQVLNMVGL